jgi:hypothetical protein
MPSAEHADLAEAALKLDNLSVQATDKPLSERAALPALGQVR